MPQIYDNIEKHLLAGLVVSLRTDARLCRVSEDIETAEPQVICSMGLIDPKGTPARGETDA